MRETYTLHFAVDPALKAYLVYLDATGEEFDPGDYDRFVARFREQVDAEHREDPMPPARGPAAGGEVGR